MSVDVVDDVVDVVVDVVVDDVVDDVVDGVVDDVAALSVAPLNGCVSVVLLGSVLLVSALSVSTFCGSARVEKWFKKCLRAQTNSNSSSKKNK